MMRRFVLVAALAVGPTSAAADQTTPVSVVHINDISVTPEQVEGVTPVANGVGALVLLGAGDTPAQIVPNLILSEGGRFTLSPQQAEQLSGRVGVMLPMHDGMPVITLSDIDTLDVDLTGNGVQDSVSFCLTGSSAQITAQSGTTGQELWGHSISLSYDVEATCD
ncbi:hypothetical protein [Tateyamaria sp. ANG-S1]|uniref:hypothetical protein n=1 Tax=Tateyamaria sp. ANG-S1 TaxID=1577905 RepID=UPI00057E0463|nr:hypothetical protein [Tateyamaria sp. ANG-S1]KIC48126.1 hypothetical protein RA29_18250 [Tateyamaria sp. ANG-S1]